MESDSATPEAALDELFEYIECQVDPELRVYAQRLKTLLNKPFACGHAASLANSYRYCKCCKKERRR